MNELLFLALDGHAPDWHPLPDWDTLYPLPAALTQGQACLHLVVWLTPSRLDPVLQALDELGHQPGVQVRVHLVLGEGFDVAETTCEFVHDVEAVLLANDQPQITTVVGYQALAAQPDALALALRHAKGSRHFLSLQAIRFSAEAGHTPGNLPASVLDLAYEGLKAAEPVLVCLPPEAAGHLPTLL